MDKRNRERRERGKEREGRRRREVEDELFIVFKGGCRGEGVGLRYASVDIQVVHIHRGF